MNWMEIALIICALSIPIIALFMVLPKIKLNKAKEEPKKVEKPAEKNVEQKVADKPKETPNNDKKVQSTFETIKYNPDDFKDYLKERSKNIVSPKKKNMPKDFQDLSFDLNRFEEIQQKQNLSLMEEINQLSPEIKAMVFANLLDKKF